MCKDGTSPACQAHLLECLAGWLAYLGMVRLHNPVKEMQSHENHVHAICTDCGGGLCLTSHSPASGRGLCHIKCSYGPGLAGFCEGPTAGSSTRPFDGHTRAMGSALIDQLRKGGDR